MNSIRYKVLVATLSAAALLYPATLAEAPNFAFPGRTLYSPPRTVNVPDGTAAVSIPATAFGPGFPPAAVQMPVSFPGHNVTLAAHVLPSPEQHVKLLNPQDFTTSGTLSWRLFDGTMRRGYRERAARADARRTDLEITGSVVRLCRGALPAGQFHQVGQDSVERRGVNLALAESLYRDGTGKANQTDYPDNVVVVETIRSTVAELDGNAAPAEAALAYGIGRPWTDTPRPSQAGAAYRPFAGGLEELVGTAGQFNPDWAVAEAGPRLATLFQFDALTVRDSSSLASALHILEASEPTLGRPGAGSRKE